MEKAKRVLVDTNILVSKKIVQLKLLERELYVTPVIILEYLNWALESYNEMMSRREYERAKGYMRLIELFPHLLDELGISVIGQEFSLEDLARAIRLVVERNVDPGDALNAVTASKLGLGVVTGDRDWLRLEDYVEEVILI